jgi:hypothetical protein
MRLGKSSQRSWYIWCVIGAELERAAAAALQAAGWYVRRGATDESFQAFELDVLGYRFPGGAEESVVVEAKGGRSGFGDLWKLLGLKTHLALDRGVLLADPNDPLHTRKVQVATGHQIDVIDRGASTIAESLAESGITEVEASDDVMDVWLRCYRVEDALIKIINDKNLWQQYKTIQLAKRQLQHLTSKAWLEPDPWRQATRLYVLYQDEPEISLSMAREINDGGAHEVFRQALYYGACAEIQACFYLEHRKRIELAFAATRCAALGDESSRWAKMAPWSFREMVETIGEEEAWYLPVVMQVYFLGFGAMICLDVEDGEFKKIARQARCTPKQARRALALFAELFPYAGGWYYDGYELSRLKLMPVPLRGAGLFMRECLYGGDWTTDLATPEQRKVAGKSEYKRALAYEKIVLPGTRATLR